jgi:hypothetical protein
MRNTIFALGIIASLGACDGPNKQAGRERDRAEATAGGRMSPAKVRTDGLAKRRTGSRARRQADIEADKLDEQARAVRGAQK